MTFANYRVRLAIGTILGDGVRSFTLESVTPELTTLRGTPEGRRQTQDASVGARRAIPTSLILDLVSAIESGRASLNDIYRTHRREQGLPPLLEFLGLDHDPFLMGYDSTIYKICQHLLSNVDAQESRNEDQRDFLIPKPFLLLAGISGTGKTRWVTDRAIEGKNNVKVIAVRPDWHEPSDLLGYVSRISSPPTFVASSGFPAFLLEAWRDSWCAEPSLNPSPNAVLRMTPHWLCLDEMNLAPVEQYFADYLSVLEERKWTTRGYRCPPLLKLAGAEDEVRAFLRLAESDPLWQAFLEVGGIPLPANLVVVGTVNMDETTHVFSRKVLDRALTVEFDEVDFGAFGGTALTSQRKGLPWTALSAVTDANDLDPPTKKEVLRLLEDWNETMANGPFRIAYRTINESLLIAGSLAEEPVAEVLDWVIMTKLLPRLEGDEDKLQFWAGEGETVLERLKESWSGFFGESWDKGRAKRKLEFMQRRLGHSGYTSFWP